VRTVIEIFLPPFLIALTFLLVLSYCMCRFTLAIICKKKPVANLTDFEAS